jgi:hypothetical protein
MKRLGACVVTLWLVAGCGNTQSLAQRDSSFQLDASNYWYAASAEASPCKTSMTISGGLKTTCAQ